MSIPLAYRFMLAGIVFVLIGMCLGIYMGSKEDFTLAPLHAHLNLVGWATMMLFGLFYRGDQVAAARTVAGWHFWIAVLGMICFIPGIAGANLGNATWAIFIIPGALLTLISMLIFAWTVWESARRHGT
jgi:hypothetical protein